MRFAESTASIFDPELPKSAMEFAETLKEYNDVFESNPEPTREMLSKFFNAAGSEDTGDLKDLIILKLLPAMRRVGELDKQSRANAQDDIDRLLGSGTGTEGGLVTTFSSALPLLPKDTIAKITVLSRSVHLALEALFESNGPSSGANRSIHNEEWLTILGEWKDVFVGIRPDPSDVANFLWCAKRVGFQGLERVIVECILPTMRRLYTKSSKKISLRTRLWWEIWGVQMREVNDIVRTDDLLAVTVRAWTQVTLEFGELLEKTLVPNTTLKEVAEFYAAKYSWSIKDLDRSSFMFLKIVFSKVAEAELRCLERDARWHLIDYYAPLWKYDSIFETNTIPTRSAAAELMEMAKLTHSANFEKMIYAGILPAMERAHSNPTLRPHARKWWKSWGMNISNLMLSTGYLKPQRALEHVEWAVGKIIPVTMVLPMALHCMLASEASLENFVNGYINVPGVFSGENNDILKIFPSQMKSIHAIRQSHPVIRGTELSIQAEYDGVVKSFEEKDAHIAKQDVDIAHLTRKLRWEAKDCKASEDSIKAKILEQQTVLVVAIDRKKSKDALLTKANTENEKLQKRIRELESAKKIDDAALLRYKEEAGERGMYKEALDQMTLERDKEVQEREQTRIALSDSQTDVQSLQNSLENIQPEKEQLRTENERLRADLDRSRLQNAEVNRLRATNAELSKQLSTKATGASPATTARPTLVTQTPVRESPNKISVAQQQPFLTSPPPKLIKDTHTLEEAYSRAVAAFYNPTPEQERPDTSKLFTSRKPHHGPMTLPLNREDDIQRSLKSSKM
ncbi:hypothetical protein BU23DRAFT_600811 [Bimuria novae-zelandiae CBS 107.79]|uniref:Uncharacterized protein n=1 Tax=Bimuria novae-zelandiae CBS 107.79 TaxID=1447943 RepID=A0A6A5V3S2_9PLEO|nr:hypothetical protein BU23DRAFT_600811 [Bimuria novae-zelandiae CBS 107.79]